jgi:hypothetical protein
MCLIATCILCGLQHDMSVCKNKKWLYLFCNMACVCLQPVSFVGCNIACQFAKNNGLYLRVAVITTWKSVWLLPTWLWFATRKKCVLATSAVSVWFAPWTDAWLQLLVSHDCNMGKNLYIAYGLQLTLRDGCKSENAPIAKLLRLCGSNVIYLFYIVLCCCVS